MMFVIGVKLSHTCATTPDTAPFMDTARHNQRCVVPGKRHTSAVVSHRVRETLAAPCEHHQLVDFRNPPFVGDRTAGIITEVTLKVHKIPAHSSSVRVAFDSIDDAAKTVQDTLAVRKEWGRFVRWWRSRTWVGFAYVDLVVLVMFSHQSHAVCGLRKSR